MSKRTIPFTIIETAVIHSEQLTWSEKRVYIALKSFRRNSPPTQCKPGQERIMQRAGVNKKTYLKARDKLKIYGLIKFEPSRSEKIGAGPGRGKTINYIFPFEDGTDEEKQRLLAFLKVKKNGTKLNRFRRKETVPFGTVLREKNGTDLHQKTVPNGTTYKKVLTRSKEQQQGKGKKPVVATLSLNKKKEKPEPIVKDNLNSLTPILTAKLRKIGITGDKAVELLANHLYSNIGQQLEWLPYRKDIKNPAGALIKAVQENWTEPPDYPSETETQRLARELRQRAIQNTILRDAREDMRKGISYERAKEWSDKLDPDYQKEFREFLRKEGYRGIAEKLSWQESDKYRGLYSRAKEELNHGSKTEGDIQDKT